MVDLKLQIPNSFFEEEIRNGYAVSEKMKKVWAVQLDMLSELERVCEKYGLRYYADSGTLIGAVRHGGYIPWDDDIDLVMMREDYNKLLEVAEQEFIYPLFFQTTYSDNKYVRGHAQIRNSATTGSTLEDHSREYNRGIFIDIFPLDNIPDNRTVAKIYVNQLKLFYKLIYCGVHYEPDDNLSLKQKIVGWIMSKVFKVIDYKTFFRCYEQICSKYNKKTTSNVSYIEYSHGKEKHIWNRKCFEEYKRVPFEFTTIVIPSGYDDRLKREYGNYMEIKEAPTSHGSLILNPEVPYGEYFKVDKM